MVSRSLDFTYHNMYCGARRRKKLLVVLLDATVFESLAILENPFYAYGQLMGSYPAMKNSQGKRAPHLAVSILSRARLDNPADEAWNKMGDSANDSRRPHPVQAT
nr:hypothetical protein CFP56_12083 [Quercus suber]